MRRCHTNVKVMNEFCNNMYHQYNLKHFMHHFQFSYYRKAVKLKLNFSRTQLTNCALIAWEHIEV